MDQIELFAPCPLLQHIINLDHAIGWHPADWRWEKVNSSDSGIREHISDIARNDKP